MRLLADFILVFGFAVIAMILFMLAISKRRQVSQNILFVLLSLILIIIITFYASLHQLKSLFLFANLFEDGIRFLIAPLLYIYIKSIFIKDKNLIKNQLLHFLPFLMYWLFFTAPVFFGEYFEMTVFSYTEIFEGTGYLALVKDVYLLTYIFFSLRSFSKFKNTMRFNYSNFNDAGYGWLKKFLISFLIVTLFDLTLVIYYVVNRPPVTWDLGLISISFLILLTFFLGYYGLKQSMIYLPGGSINDEIKKTKKKNGNSHLYATEEELHVLKVKLEHVLTYAKPYLFQKITLSTLAEHIGTTDKKLSTLLNRSMDVSFYDLINQYRVEAVKESLRLEEYTKYSVEGVAYSCGFNSKSSFYRAFKKETGISPVEYKKGIFM